MNFRELIDKLSESKRLNFARALNIAVPERHLVTEKISEWWDDVREKRNDCKNLILTALREIGVDPSIIGLVDELNISPSLASPIIEHAPGVSYLHEVTKRPAKSTSAGFPFSVQGGDMNILPSSEECNSSSTTSVKRLYSPLDDSSHTSSVSAPVPRHYTQGREMALSLPIVNENLSILLFGKTGNGKSSTGCTLLNDRSAFECDSSVGSVTKDCKKKDCHYGGYNLSVVDTPGVFDTSMPLDELFQKISLAMLLSPAGYHVIFIVLKYNQRFTSEEAHAIDHLEKLFGREIFTYAIIVVTHADLFQKHKKRKPQATQLDYMLKDQVKDFTRLFEKCGSRFVFCDNDAEDLENERGKLLAEVQKLVAQNNGNRYTNELFKAATEVLRKLKEKQEAEKRAAQKRQKDLEASASRAILYETQLRSAERENERLDKLYVEEKRLAKVREDRITQDVQHQLLMFKISEEETKKREEARRKEEKEEREKLKEQLKDIQKSLSAQKPRYSDDYTRHRTYEDDRLSNRRTSLRGLESYSGEELARMFHDLPDNEKEKVIRQVSPAVREKAEKAGACFPKDASCILAAGSVLKMERLQQGDKVQVVLPDGALDYQEVFMFSHADPNTEASFLVFMTENQRQLSISPGHYLYVKCQDGKMAMVPARDVEIDDALYTYIPEKGTMEFSAVTEIKTESLQGLYNPHTRSGTIIVNGVLASCYTEAFSPVWAHRLLQPVWFLYKMAPWINRIVAKDGMPVWLSFLDIGKSVWEKMGLSAWQ